MNWTEEEAATVAKGLFFSKWQGEKIVFDSRLIEKNDIFLALPGATSDGHEHVLDALNKGAAAAIVSKIPESLTSKDKLLLVDDTKEALYNLASYKRNNSKAKFIAITGSVGKTSTKEQLKLAFSAHGEVFAGRGNYNNFLGVPINLASMPNDIEYGILEIGMDHAGEITPLSNLVRPNVAIITAIENIHRANFDSIEDIARSKAEIFDGTEEGSIAIINESSNCCPLLRDLLKNNKNISKVIAIGSDSKLISYSIQNNETFAKLDILGQEIQLKFDGVMPIHQIHNMVIVLTCVASLGLNPAESVEELQKFILPRGRGLVSKIEVEGKLITLIDDSYNAGPVSVTAALKNMSYYNGRKIAILGDMVDLGPDSLSFHVNLKDDIESNRIDKVICFGKQMQNLYQALPEEKRMGSYLDLKTLAKDLPIKLQAGDILLIKGSLYINNLYGFTKYLVEGRLNQIE